MILDMGKRWFRKNKKKLKNADGPVKKVRPEGGYEDLIRENTDFEKYYKAQNIVPSEEWETFMQCLKEDLPAAFRLTGSSSQSKSLLNILQERFFQPMAALNTAGLNENIDTTAAKALMPICLTWYPYGLGWQLNLTRKDIRHSENFWKLHQFLISETETGNISRQEAVSMIPPLLLDVKHNHKVLDMCAAPGSKTAQIIEFLHSSHKQQSVPSGVVVANDSDNKRCYMLTHQAKRLQSPTLVITNHDAAFFPNINITRKDGSLGPMKFDRILCDVPCSGDGTLRKNFDVWSKWNAANGANLHGLQLRIARRGLEMLAVGGRLIYSTCSMNPLEDEAVINRLLDEAGGSIRLVDVSASLPGLKFVPGLQEWKIMNRELETFSSPEEISEKNMNLLHKHLFPPSKEDRQSRHLERCMRILPHHQDTGGFFVVVIEKLRPYPGEKVYVEGAAVSVQTTEAVQRELTQRIKLPPKKRRCKGYKEEPFYYLSRENPIWKSIFSFYGIEESVDPSLFLTRSQDGKGKNLYFTNALVKDIVINNVERIKIINTGVKVFVRCDNKGSFCDFRLSQDGAQMFFSLFEKRKLLVAKEDMIEMLLNDDVNIPPQISSLSDQLQKQSENLDCGSVTFTYRSPSVEGNDEEPVEITLVGWKGKNSVRCYIVKNERLHYLRLMGVDTSNLEYNKFAEQRSLQSDVTNKVDDDTLTGQYKAENSS